ncbi:hypothetical protein BHE90_013683 [Fusarium euwallaceae]|uniref:Uncharacterized protein n=1 Tax=Fusarium euwallaceae TaxID=1147111 RepID=A0A430L878_9HYPO|nr:hypothetical protein BHE90_013683 [Fusarium euwallaceae]
MASHRHEANLDYDGHRRRYNFSPYRISDEVYHAAWSAALAYFKVSNENAKKKDHQWDLWSWTCNARHRKGEVNWNSLCIEMTWEGVGSDIVSSARRSLFEYVTC